MREGREGDAVAAAGGTAHSCGKEGAHHLPRRLPAETLRRTVVPGTRRSARLRRADRCEQRGLLGVQAPDQPVRVLVRPPLPGVVQGGEEHAVPQLQNWDISAWPANSLPLSNVIPVQITPIPLNSPRLGADHVRLLGRHPPHQCEPGHPLHQCHGMAVPAAPATEVALGAPARHAFAARLPAAASRSAPAGNHARPRPSWRGSAACACASRAPDASKGRLPAFASAYTCL